MLTYLLTYFYGGYDSNPHTGARNWSLCHSLAKEPFTTVSANVAYHEQYVEDNQKNFGTLSSSSLDHSGGFRILQSKRNTRTIQRTIVTHRV